MSETDQFSQYAKEKHIYGTKLTEQSNYWNDRAEECRTLAELLRAPRAKARMLQVADTYERLARQATRQSRRLIQSPRRRWRVALAVRSAPEPSRFFDL
jgi:hypothetical protein